MTETEKKIVIFLNQLHWKWLDFVSDVISNIKFLAMLWIGIIAYAMIVDLKFGIELMLKLLAVFAVHYLISELIIKHGAKRLKIKRTRPYAKYPSEIRAIGHNFSDSSFPSSHVSSVVGGLVILYAAFPFAWPALIVFAILLALSRLHNGMHYPTDILAGVVLGLAYGCIILFLM